MTIAEARKKRDQLAKRAVALRNAQRAGSSAEAKRRRRALASTVNELNRIESWLRKNDTPEGRRREDQQRVDAGRKRETDQIARLQRQLRQANQRAAQYAANARANRGQRRSFNQLAQKERNRAAAIERELTSLIDRSSAKSRRRDERLRPRPAGPSHSGGLFDFSQSTDRRDVRADGADVSPAAAREATSGGSAAAGGSGGGGGGEGTGGGFGGGGGGVAGGTEGAGSDDEVYDEYPQYTWALDHPELGPILRRAAKEDYSAGRLQAEIFRTNWWQTTGRAQREWIALAGTDPAEASIRLRAVEETNQMLAAAAQYGVPLTEDGARSWAQKVVRGEVGPDDVQGFLRSQAKSLYPGLAKQFDDGYTLEQIGASYRSLAAQRLGIAESEVRFSDPKWNRALNAVDPKTGERRALTLSEWETVLKTDDQYGYDNSREAITEAAQFADGLARMFGRVA